MATAEQRSREDIDGLLIAAGSSLQDFKQATTQADHGAQSPDQPGKIAIGAAAVYEVQLWKMAAATRGCASAGRTFGRIRDI